MSNYLAPTDAPVSSDWADHKYRDPPSPEPGTDYACAYGTDLAMPSDGVIVETDHSPSGGEGRRLGINLDDGKRLDLIHLSSIAGWVGMRVGRGQQGICLSGASGNGSDWYYGAHVHVTLREWPGKPYWDTIDFEQHIGEVPAPVPVQTAKGGSMFLIKKGSNPDQIMLVTADGGQLRVRYLEDAYERAVLIATVPALPLTICDDPTFDGFLARVGYAYGAPIPLLEVEAANVPAGRTRRRSSELVAPAWAIVGLLAVVAIVEVVRAALGV